MKKENAIATIVVILALVLGWQIEVNNLRNDLVETNTKLVEVQTEAEDLGKMLDFYADKADRAEVAIDAYHNYCIEQFEAGKIDNRYGPFVDNEYINTIVFFDYED